jgi:peptidoglycan/LPS O-acetylase OafA/YrhL
VTAGADFRHDIQALRGIAVLLVVLFHAFESRIRHGYLGVDVFFVISGSSGASGGFFPPLCRRCW